MNRLLSSITLTFLLASQFLSLAVSAQEAVALKDFKIEAPTEVFINEAFDLTIEAVDGAGKKLDKYEGTVFFDTNNNPADVVLPFENGEYQFTLNDAGKHTFAKGFTLKKAGKYELVIFELDGPNGGVEKTIEVTAVAKDGPPAPKVDIVIKEPSTNTTVSTKTLPVSGTAKANSKVNIKLNGVKVKDTQTLEDGKFAADIGELKAGDNVIIAEVLDKDGAVAGTSAPVTIKFSTEVPKLTSLTIKEGDEFFAGSSITFVGVGDQSLKVVQVKVGDKTALLTEDKTKL